jgi:hypothetical protein
VVLFQVVATKNRAVLPDYEKVVDNQRVGVKNDIFLLA